MKHLYKLYIQNKDKEDWVDIVKSKLYNQTSLKVYNWFDIVCKKESYIQTLVFGKFKIKGGPDLVGNPNFYVIKISKSNQYYISNFFCNKKK